MFFLNLYNLYWHIRLYAVLIFVSLNALGGDPAGYKSINNKFQAWAKAASELLVVIFFSAGTANTNDSQQILTSLFITFVIQENITLSDCLTMSKPLTTQATATSTHHLNTPPSIIFGFPFPFNSYISERGGNSRAFTDITSCIRLTLLWCAHGSPPAQQPTYRVPSSAVYSRLLPWRVLVCARARAPRGKRRWCRPRKEKRSLELSCSEIANCEEMTTKGVEKVKEGGLKS